MGHSRINFKKQIIRLGVFFITGGVFLSACSTSNSADQAVNWLYLVLAIVMVLGLGIGLGVLIKSGKFKKWGSSGLNLNKWRLQESRLTNQKEKLEGEIEGLTSKLGQKAWEARVSDPSYADAFDALVMLDQQKNQLAEETVALEEELEKTGDSRSKLAKEYTQQINDLESLHKDVTKKIEKTQSEQLKLQKELEKVADQQGKSQAEVEDQQTALETLSASDDPDKEAKIAEIGEKIKALQAANTGAMTRISEIESERSQLEVEQQPFEDKVTRLADQITTVEADQTEALAPLDQKIAQLEATIQEKKNAIEALEQEIAPKALALGPSVEAARPKSEALSGLYKKIDETQADLGEASQELHLVAARLETCDQGAVRNFYWMVAGILILVALSVIFFILAFV